MSTHGLYARPRPDRRKRPPAVGDRVRFRAAAGGYAGQFIDGEIVAVGPIGAPEWATIIDGEGGEFVRQFEDVLILRRARQ